MKGTDINESIITCCNILGIDVESLSEGALKSMEDSMKLNKEKKVLAIHKYKLPSRESYQNGRQKTSVPNPTMKDKRQGIWAYSYDEMIDRLYEYYFENTSKFRTVFEEMCEHCIRVGKPRLKTVEEYRNTFKFFFKDEPIADKNINHITVDDMSEFFIKAHHKVSKLDKERGMTCIEKHRHDQLITVINKIYKYAKVSNPITSISFDTSDYPYYSLDKLEDPEGYSKEDITKLLNVFDNLKKPTIPQLVIGAILETYARIGEIRALRFSDFHFDGDNSYIRICGLANGSRREERVKKDSASGKRNLEMTPRLKRIYELGKELSWSDTFIFVKEKKYVTKDDIETNNVCVTDDAVRRALITLCKKAGITYYPPHQIRFYGAMEMVNETEDIYSVSHFLGHTNLKTTQHYTDKLNSQRIFRRSNNKVS